MVNVLRIPDYVEVETEENKNSSNVEVVFTRTSYGMQVHCCSSEERPRVIILRWNGKIPVNTRILKDAWERGYGHQEWMGMSASCLMPWYFMASCEGVHMGYGVMTQTHSMCCWEADTKGVTLYLDVRCGGTGVILGQRRLHAATIVSEEYAECSSFEATASFCKKMCGSIISAPSPVYGSNNWYYAYGKSSEQEILADADYLAELTKGIQNRPFMVIDDGWQKEHVLEHYNGGPWRSGNAAFPDMARLAQEICKKNLKAGIWFRPLLNDSAELPKEARLCAGNTLDPSHPEALKYIKEDLVTICKWGFTLIKHDFSTFDIFGKWGNHMYPFPAQDGWHFYDRTRTSAEIIVDFYRMIYETTAPYQTIVLGCNTIGHLGAGLVHVQRIGDDTSGWLWDRTRRMGVNSLAFRLPQHKNFFDVDADCVGITDKIPWEKNRQFAHLIANSGTSLFVSVAPGTLDENQKKELHEIFKTASEPQPGMIPEDWEYTDCPETWNQCGERIHYDWYDEKGSRFVEIQ